MAAAEPFSEVVTGGKLLIGGKAPRELRVFAQILCRSYDAEFEAPSALI